MKKKILILVFALISLVSFSQRNLVHITVENGDDTFTRKLPKNAWVTVLSSGITYQLSESQPSGSTMNTIITSGQYYWYYLPDGYVPGVTDTTNWYFAADGNDDNDGHSINTPKRNISELNTLVLELNDTIFFRAGDTFDDAALTVSNSGTSGNDIVFSSYGAGDNPVISGFATINGFTNTTGNIWVSDAAVSELSSVNMVVIDDENIPMGREPDSGYYFFQSHSDNYHITSTDLVGGTSWIGAELALNVNEWVTKRCPITGHNTGTGELTFTQPEAFTIAEDDLKFIIQNDSLALDTQNEWYYNPNTKKLVVYSVGEPTNVLVSVIDTLVEIYDEDYITFNNIEFIGSNEKSISLNQSNNITINNCDFDYSGRDAIYGGNFSTTSSNLTVTNCTFDNSNNGAIGVTYAYLNATISNNTVSNTGMIYGASPIYQSGTNGAGLLTAISAMGSNSTFENNVITNTGYRGLNFWGSNVTVRNNYVYNYCRINHDGGGIYTFNNYSGKDSIFSNVLVEYNIVLNDSTTSTGQRDFGLYFDDFSNGFNCQYNTVCAVQDGGINLHNDSSAIVRYNTIYNVAEGIRIRNDQFATHPMNDVLVSNNKIILTDKTQQLVFFDYVDEFLTSSFVLDSNIWTNPTTEDSEFFVKEESPVVNYYYNLAQWQTYSSQDSHSSTAAYPADDVFFIYNPSATEKDTTLSGTYLDVAGTAYSGEISIPAWESLVLLDTTTYQQQLLTDQMFYYTLNGASGIDTINANNLTNSGAVFGATGVSNQAVNFDDAGDDLSVSYDSDFMPTGNAFTISLWVKESNLSGNPYLFTWRTATSPATIMYIRAIGSYVRGYVTNTDASNFYVNSDPDELSLQNDTWYFVTFVNYNNAPAQMYVNGALMSQNTEETTTLKTLSDGAMYIGNQYATTGASPDYLDEVGGWNKALTSGAIYYLYINSTYPFTE